MILKLQPVLKDYLWGGTKLKTMYHRGKGEGIVSESWEVSVHPDGMCRVGDITLADYIKDNPDCVDAGISPFPVLIKYIDAAKDLSVQVHPDDAYAQRNEGDLGKTEMWYIIDADEGAGICCGFKEDTDRDTFLSKVNDGTVEDLLNFIPVKAGDAYLIEAGTVHAIGAGCVICEVQQSSNVTYRVYDYDRVGTDGKKRPLHIEKAVEVMDFRRFEDRTHTGAYEQAEGGQIRVLTHCRYFACRELLLDGTHTYENRASFTAVNVIAGQGMINGEPFVPGDSFFVPAKEQMTLKGKAKIILTAKDSTY